MPTYDYRCDHCGHEFSRIQSFTEGAVEVCPNCGQRPTRLMSLPSIVFKGSGWYKTDSRRSPSSEGSSGPSGSPGTSGTSDKSDAGKSDARKSDAGKSDAGKSDAAKGDKKTDKPAGPAGGSTSSSGGGGTSG